MTLRRSKREIMRALVLGLLSLLVVAVAVIPRLTGLRWILVEGPSVNVALGLIGPAAPGELRAGDYVMLVWNGVDPNGIERLHQNVRLIKRVACLPGQHLKVTMRQADCDGVKIGHIRHETMDGRPIIPALYDGIIPERRFFLLGEHFFSYDSRYFGLVPYDWIHGKLTVVL